MPKKHEWLTFNECALASPDGNGGWTVKENEGDLVVKVGGIESIGVSTLVEQSNEAEYLCISYGDGTVHGFVNSNNYLQIVSREIYWLMQEMEKK